MQVSIILDNEYMGVMERNKWFLKYVSYAQDNDCFIITHEIFEKKLDEIVDGCADRFYPEFEMNRVSADKIRTMDVAYVPDSFFEELYCTNGARTRMILDLTENRNEFFESFMINAINEQLSKRNEKKPECIFYCMNTFASVRYLSEYYDCPLVPFVFSSVRKVHGYSQTLYMAHMDGDLFNSGECEKLYQSFNKDELGFDLFNRKELLALIGKKQNFCLFPMLESNGVYNMGVIGEGFHMTPQTYLKEHLTDDDLYSECDRYYDRSTVVSRLHPIMLDQTGFGRSHMKNDPASFILSCKRLTTTRSQMILKAALWNRPTCIISHSLPYAFLFSRDFTESKPMSESDLNFILFSYFMPDSCMFSSDYWKWRLTNPTANELFAYHIKQIFNNLGIDESVLYEKDRIYKILKMRGCTDSEIEKYLAVKTEYNDDIQFNYLSSKAVCYSDDNKLRDMFVLNSFEGNNIVSVFETEDTAANRMDLYLTNDIDGFVCIKSICVNESSVEADSSLSYWSKNSTGLSVELPAKKNIVKVIWSVKSFADEFSN